LRITFVEKGGQEFRNFLQHCSITQETCTGTRLVGGFFVGLAPFLDHRPIFSITQGVAAMQTASTGSTPSIPTTQHPGSQRGVSKRGRVRYLVTQCVRRTLSPVLVAFTLAAMLMLAFSYYASSPAAAQDVQAANATASIVVQFDDSARVLRAINFSEPLSGYMALQLSGLRVVTASTSFGPAICSIEDVGCPAEDCFCDASRYWGYSYWDGAAWQSYPVGAGSSVISQTGAIEGWRWGEYGDPQIAPAPSLAAAEALLWLQESQVISDGGYGSPGASVESMLALGANHEKAAAWRANVEQPSLADYVALQGGIYARSSVAAAGKLAVALAASESCLPIGAISPQAYYSPTLGAYSDQAGANSWAILGSLALSETVPAQAIDHLKNHIQPEGGWEWGPGWGADTNATALALQALVAAGEPISASEVVSGLAFLKAAQNSDGGFPYTPGPDSASDANSTAYVVQALVAAGEDPLSPTWTISNSHPISYLLSLQLPDGSFEWQPGTGANLLATQQAIPALLGRAHPVVRQQLESCPAIYLPVVNYE
jgi:hypothetical protein